VFIQASGIEAGEFLRCEGIQVPTHVFHALRNVMHSTLGCALEHHVFDEMAHAGVFSTLIATAYTDPGTHGYTPDRWNGLGYNPNAVGQSGFLESEMICHLHLF